MVKEVTYQCQEPTCHSIHTVKVVEWLPNDPLAIDDIDRIRENDGIQAATYGDFRAYTGDDEEYRNSHTDLLFVAIDATTFKLRFIPTAGWAIEHREPLDGRNPHDVVNQLRDDYLTRRPSRANA